MKRKSILFLILTFLCTLTLGIFTACDGDENSLAVKDWGNEKVTCKLGDCYEIPRYEAKGNGGENYEVTVLVIKKDGNVAIPLIDGAFDVTSKKGYEVQYTATDGEKSAKKVLSVKVVDETAPNISCFSATIATVGVRYEWTDITVMDSGVEIEKYNVEVYNAATDQKVSSDQTGFTPTDMGDHYLKITATDGDGNQGELTYTIFARPNATGGEVENADDPGVKYAVYTFGVSATQKIYSEYSTFTRLSKGGSAVISSELGSETGVFITPRKDVEYTDTGYFSAWTYILDCVCEKRTVKTSLSEIVVPTNQWVEIKLDQTAIGGYKTFWDKFKSGGTSLFSVVNNATDYAIFLDDVYFVQSANVLDGVKENYQAGEKLTFTATQGATVELSALGKTEPVQSGTILSKAGTYTLTAYDSARVKAAVSKTFTVGTNSVFFDDEESWFTAGENKAPKVVDDKGNLVKATYYIVNAKTGEKTQLASNRKFSLSEEKAIFLLAEGTYKGKAFTLYKGYDVRRAGKGVLYSFDDSSYVISQSGWHEEFAGEKGVLELYISSGGNSSTKGWRTSFSKEYYQQFKYLRFKVYATHTFGMALLSLSKWDTISLINESNANKLNQWNYYYVDIEKYMANYDSINGNSDLGVWMDAKGGKIYVAEIAAVQEIGGTDDVVKTEDGVGGAWDEQWK